ncbi:MAG: hypothetical protein CSA07_04925 [Bacteroidia bacterium]|nr:MAG: hypothetical protein CSA07_04925 [Bacteroidia bacterium]
MLLLLKGLLVGFLASAPLGPIGVVVVQRTLSRGRWNGFASGYGAGLADTLFATVAVFGISMVIDFVEAYRTLIVVGAGVIVVLLGYVTFRRDPLHDLRKRRRGETVSYWREIVYVMMLTLTNPLSILLFLTLFALLSAAPTPGHADEVVVLLAGVHAGAIGWWFLLSGTVSHFRKRIRLRQIVVFNRVGGVVIMVLGLVLTIASVVARVLGG